ncbi:MAG: hypothetical protein IPJ88_04235 [Myxococcales bacterium]|nr:MAG: hypothetical protein IPJ88_04235 [Myxococcales bacterium]
MRWLFILLLSGCFFQNASAQERLKDAVTELNDHARWGRSYAALQIVHPKYRGRFSERRETWGKDVQIADVDIQQVKMDDDKQEATSSILVSWYSFKDMQLQNTIIEQNWERADSGYQLVKERVVEGNKHLLEH